MHKGSSSSMVPDLSIGVDSLCCLSQQAKRKIISSFIGKVSGVMNYQQGSSYARSTLPDCLEVPTKDLHLAEALAGEETIGSFGISPILARGRNAIADPV